MTITSNTAKIIIRKKKATAEGTAMKIQIRNPLRADCWKVSGQFPNKKSDGHGGVLYGKLKIWNNVINPNYYYYYYYYYYLILLTTATTYYY